MSHYLVEVTHDSDGHPADRGEYRAIIEDRRAGAFDLIREANRRWGTRVVPGEVYRITPIPEKVRDWKVEEVWDGELRLSEVTA